MVKHCIYALIDPRDNEVRYIGQTSQIDKRYNYHCGGFSKGRVGNWIKNLLNDDLKPSLEIIEDDLTQKGVNDRERHWIAYGRENGWRLTNLTDGGEGMPNPSNEVRKVLSEKAKEAWRNNPQSRTASPEVRAKISKANKGRRQSLEERAMRSKAMQARDYNHSPETIEKIRQWNIGRKMPKEAVEKMAASKRGKKLSKETREKISRAMKGKKGHPMSPGHLKKMIAARDGKSWNKGIPMSEKTKRKLSEANKNKPRSLETRAKIAATNRSKFDSSKSWQEHYDNALRELMAK